MHARLDSRQPVSCRRLRHPMAQTGTWKLLTSSAKVCRFDGTISDLPVSNIALYQRESSTSIAGFHWIALWQAEVSAPFVCCEHASTSGILIRQTLAQTEDATTDHAPPTKPHSSFRTSIHWSSAQPPKPRHSFGVTRHWDWKWLNWVTTSIHLLGSN